MADLPNTIALDDDDDDDFDTRDNCIDSSASASNNCAIAYLLRISLRDGQTLTEFPLLKPTTTIGRKKSNDIILMDQTVSSEHAEVEVEPRQRKAFVVDLNSTNKTRTGTQLPSVVHQNKKIKANRECILESGHYVTFGDVHFRFFHAHDYQNRDLQPDAEHKHVENSGNANVLPETQSFDEDDTATSANTQLNRTNRSQIDLKLSVSDDENGAGANRESPRKVQFEGVSQSQQSERSVQLAPTLEWNDDDDDDTQKSVALAQTVAYDDDVDADQEENGEEEDAVVANLPATVACPDEDEDETQEDTLPATMAVEEDGSEADDAQQSSHQQLLAATLAVDDDDDGNEDGDELAPTLALCDDNDNEEEEEERPVLAATMAVDATEALPATIAMDENAEETTDDADVLPATVAMDDNETDDDGDAVMNENRDEDCLPATVAMGEVNDEGPPRECEEELPATVAMPDADDDDEEDETQEPEQQPQQHALPATVAFEDEDADVDNLAATLAVLSDTDNDADADERALPATLAVAEEQVAHQAQNAQYLLQSEKQPLVMTDDDEQQNQQQEIDSKPSMVAQTERIDTEDVDLGSASMSSRSLTNRNHNLDHHIANGNGNDKNDNKDDHVHDTGNESDLAQSAAEVVDANVVLVANQDSSKNDESECGIKKKITQDDDDEDYVVEEEEEEAAVEEEDEDDEDGDVSMGDNRPLLKSRRASGGLKSTGNQKETPRQRAAQKKKSVPSSSLLSLFAMRGRGRKRSVNQRDEEDSDKEREEKADETQDAETRIQAPPAKRARRGRRSSKSGQSESESESDASKSKRRPTKQRLPSPNKRNRSNTSVRRSKRLSSMPAAHTESDSDAAGAGGATGKRVVLLRTGTNNPKERQKLQEMGAVVLDEYDESVTHIVSSQPRRTLKFICGLATAKHIVTDAWPSQCVKKQTLEVDEQRYFPSNKATKTVEKQYGFSLKKSFQSLQQRAVALFDGYKVYFTKDFPTNQKKGIAPMAQAHGAAVMSRLPRATRNGQIDDDVIVIGFSADDSKDHDTLIKKGYDVYNKEIIITSILRQEINFDDESFVLQ